MKKIFIALMLCLVSMVSMAQSAQYLDEIGRIIKYDMVNTDDYYTMFKISTSTDTIYEKTKTSLVYNYDEVSVPTILIRDYKYGKTCEGIGIGSLVIGLPLVAAGVACYFNDKHNVGIGLMAAGSTLVTIGIPLWCFGGMLKRESNTNYWLYNMGNEW